MIKEVPSIRQIIEKYESAKGDAVRIGHMHRVSSARLDKRVAIYGAGVYSLPALLQLLAAMGVTPVAVTDSDENKWGRTVCSHTILSPAQVKEQFGAAIQIIISVRADSGAAQNINRTLNACGFSNIMQCAEWLSYRELLQLGDYNMMSVDGAEKIPQNIVNIERLAALLEDGASQTALVEIIKARLLPYDFAFAYQPSAYFPQGIWSDTAYRSVVDCGAYRGDTLHAFLALNKPFQAYHAFEMDPHNVQILSSAAEALHDERVHVHGVAVGSKNDFVTIHADGSAGSHFDAVGETRVPCVRLDDILKNEQASYVKMDIEGAERQALEGAEGILQSDRPVLVISLYHRDTDLWELPLYIATHTPRYAYFIRREDLFEYVFYAVPEEKLV